MEITPAQLAQEWRGGNFRPAYYLCGEEQSTKEDALAFLKKSADDFNYREFSKSEAAGKNAEIISELQSLPVFAKHRIIIVELPDSAAALKKALADYLKNPAPASVLVLHSEDAKPDAKDALPRLVLGIGAVCIFSKLTVKDAIERLKTLAQKNKKTISQEAAEFLVNEIGTNWGILKQEIEKLALFTTGPTIEADEAAQSLGYHKASDPFALNRLIEKRLKKEALAYLHQFFEEGKPQDQAFRALNQMTAMILKQLKAKKMLEARLSREEISRSLRLHAYWDKDFLGDLSKFSEARLRADLKKCLQADVRLKSQTWIDPIIEVEELAQKLCETGAQ